MAVLIRHRAAGITPAQYDQISPPLLAELKDEPGFVLPVAFEDSQGFCVAEIWERKSSTTATSTRKWCQTSRLRSSTR